MSGFKRPIPRPRVAVHGASAPCPVPPGSTGIVADIVAKMRSANTPQPRVRAWRPSCEYEFLAARLPEEEGAALIKRSREWFEAHSPPPPKASDAIESTINCAPLAALFAEYSRKGVVPPTAAHAKALRAAGYPEERVQKFLAWKQHLEDTSEERQEALDRIFSKYPTSSKLKAKAKPEKVIKAVKKKMV